jgi:hypothetical protein
MHFVCSDHVEIQYVDDMLAEAEAQGLHSPITIAAHCSMPMCGSCSTAFTMDFEKLGVERTQTVNLTTSKTAENGFQANCVSEMAGFEANCVSVCLCVCMSVCLCVCSVHWSDSCCGSHGN